MIKQYSINTNSTITSNTNANNDNVETATTSTTLNKDVPKFEANSMDLNQGIFAKFKPAELTQDGNVQKFQNKPKELKAKCMTNFGDFF